MEIEEFNGRLLVQIKRLFVPVLKLDSILQIHKLVRHLDQCIIIKSYKNQRVFN